MTKKVIAFDLDDTLAVTKSPISDKMGLLLVRLMENMMYVLFLAEIFISLKFKL